MYIILSAFMLRSWEIKAKGNQIKLICSFEVFEYIHM